MERIRVGIVGTGFIAHHHMRAYARVYGVRAEVVAACSRGEGARAFAEKYGIPKVFHDYTEMLADPDIDLVDLCTPPQAHHTMIEDSVRAGKHVVCEKPFTGYFGEANDPRPVGVVSKETMYEAVLRRMERTAKVVAESGKLFLYAEDWVYAPAVAKAAEILEKTRDRILFLKAEESHSGSHAPHAREWEMTGGGAMIRQGCHPISAVIHLKMTEARVRGERFGIREVLCDTGNIVTGLSKEERRFIAASPHDVEDWAMLTLTFHDGTKATVFAADFVTGGVRNLIELNTTSGTLKCNIAPNDGMMSFSASHDVLKDIYLTEKVETNAGWQYIILDEESARGYLQEIQDFVECAATGREPLSGMALACETMRAVYAGYLSAERGVKISL